MNKSIPAIFIMTTILLSCNSGSTSSSSISTKPALKVIISGLHGAATLNYNDTDTFTVTHDRDIIIDDAIATDDVYKLQITSKPPHQTVTPSGAPESGSFDESNQTVTYTFVDKTKVDTVLKGKKIFLNPNDSAVEIATGITINQNCTAFIKNYLSKYLAQYGALTTFYSGTSSTIAAQVSGSSCDVFLRISINTGGGTGTETARRTADVSNLALNINNCICSNIITYQTSDWTNRGVQINDDNSYLKSITIPAAICFLGFHDSTHDLPYLLNTSWQKEAAKGIVYGFFKQFGTAKMIPQPPINQSASVTGNTVTLSWQKASDTTSQDSDTSKVYFLIYTSTDGIIFSSDAISTENLSYSFANLESGTYYYRISTYHTSAGESIISDAVSVNVP